MAGSGEFEDHFGPTIRGGGVFAPKLRRMNACTLFYWPAQIKSWKEEMKLAPVLIYGVTSLQNAIATRMT
jgi:hypothetical protein